MLLITILKESSRENMEMEFPMAMLELEYTRNWNRKAEPPIPSKARHWDILSWFSFWNSDHQIRDVAWRRQKSLTKNRNPKTILSRSEFQIHTTCIIWEWEIDIKTKHKHTLHLPEKMPSVENNSPWRWAQKHIQKQIPMKDSEQMHKNRDKWAISKRFLISTFLIFKRKKTKK